MRALDRKLLRDIWRMKTQVLTIAMVIASGVGACIGSLSAHTSLVHLRDNYYETGRFAHVFAAAKRAPERLADALRAIPDVADVETTVAGNVLVSLPDVTESMAGLVIALPRHGQPNINRVVLKSGRWVEPHDSEGVLVSEAFAEARGLEPDSTVTLLINGQYETFAVRGIALSPQFIYAAAPGGFSDDTRYGVFWLSRERLDAAFDMDGAFNSVALRLTRGASVRQVIAATDRLLEPFGSTGAYGREDQMSHRLLTQEIDEQQVFAVVFPVVFMTVALFLLNLMLSRHIATERSQIATLKALGYSNSGIGVHYAKLVSLIALIGVLMGIGIGAWFGHWMTGLYTRFYHFPTADYQMELQQPFMAAVLTFSAAIAATFSAIRAVARLPPAEAMQPPAPQAFRQTLLDRWGFSRVYSPEVRMIVREMERRPLRAGLTSFGIAAAIAVLIAGTWWNDAFDELMWSEFGLRERADVLVALAEPTEVHAIHELSRLPGVLAAEASRDVAADLRSLHYRVRTNIIGLEPDAKLRQTLNDDMKPLPLIAGGIALTDSAARSLHVRPGESIWVDPLEGSEPARLVPITQIVGDLMGTVAYMPRREAAALVGREDTITTVRLQLDSRSKAAFFERVREIPRIAAVGDKALMLRHFRSTQARNLLFFTGILSVFAAAISVGVVYNSARIQLAEHSWELATLRVLGFTRAEVSRMLLGQLAVQILIAMPAGCILGYGLSALIVSLIESDQMRIPLVVLPSTYAYSILVMLGAGIVSAMVVRRRIDKLDLVGVLKTRE